MVVLSVVVTVLDADSGSPLVAAQLTDAVVPEPARNLLIGKPTENEHLASYLGGGGGREGGRKGGREGGRRIRKEKAWKR